MADIKARLRKLEERIGSRGDQINIYTTLHGVSDDEVKTITVGDNLYERLPGERIEDFKARVEAQAPDGINVMIVGY